MQEDVEVVSRIHGLVADVGEEQREDGQGAHDEIRVREEPENIDLVVICIDQF